MGIIKDISGQKIGSWTVLNRSERKTRDGIYYWNCRCDCGAEREVRGQNLRNGQSIMCTPTCPLRVAQIRNKIFEKKIIEAKNGCWIWTGIKNSQGYGQIGKSEKAHRFSYQRFIGKIPPHLCVLHSCDNPSCVNPKHLFLGTLSENNIDVQGEDNSKNKLQEKDIIKIRTWYISGNRSKASLAREFGVSHPTISQILKRETWKHVP